ncbi:hypothetical protein [Xanthomonas sp. GPE 39]|uniref:hypothetical protein n=1 Tax=Xanthomonas sp. GPE 39 TaxID=1583099 RepID=UPI00126A1728|nr:hypothetical protein [Xanthomonas sp. GPE 39]
MQISADYLKEFIFEKGYLHDCEISEFSLSGEFLEVSILNLNENFNGLPECSGSQSGRIIFNGVKLVRVDVSGIDGGLRIYEALFSIEDEMKIMEFLLSPAGRITVHSLDICLKLINAV